MKWNPSPEFICQAAHAEMGALFVLLPAALGFGLPWRLAFTAFFIAYAVLKEAYWDPKFEDGNPFWKEGAFDLSFLLGGNVLAWALLFLFHRT